MIDAVKIDLAMTYCQGNRAKVAVVLGMEAKQLSSRIHSSAKLKAKWAKDTKKPPTALQSINAPAKHPNGCLPMAPPLDPVALVEARIEFAQAEIKHDLATVGLDEKESDLGAKLFALEVRNSSNLMGLLGGGQVRAAMKLLSMIDRLVEDPYPDEYNQDKQLVRVGRRATDEMILRAQSEFGKRAMEHHQMALIRMKAKQIAESRHGAKTPHGKPGFSQPPDNKVIVQSGGTAIFGNTAPAPQTDAGETSPGTGPSNEQ